MIVGEWLGETVLNNPLSKSVDRAIGSRSFSWLRIGDTYSVLPFGSLRSCSSESAFGPVRQVRRLLIAYS
jgi:hypothetical protein